MRCSNGREHCALRGRSGSDVSNRPSVEDWRIVLRLPPLFIYQDEIIGCPKFLHQDVTFVTFSGESSKAVC